MKKLIYSIIALLAITTYSYSQVTIADWNGTNQSFTGTPSGCVVTAPIANPNPSGINTSTNVMKVHTSSDQYDIAYANLSYYLNFSSVNAITLKVYSGVSGPVTLKIAKQSDMNVNKIELTGYYYTPGQWQEVRFNFYCSVSDNNTYNQLSILPDYGGTGSNDWYFDDIKTFNCSVITNFDDVSRQFSVYNTSTPTVVTNPSSGGISINNTPKCLQIVSSSDPYENIKTVLEGNLDFSHKNAVSYMVYSDSIGIMTLKLQRPDLTNDIIQEYQYTAPGTWQQLTYDLTGTPSNAYNSITIYPNIENTTANVNWYIDEMTIDSVQITSWQSHIIANFDNIKRAFRTWSSPKPSIVANPGKDAVNSSDYVLSVPTSVTVSDEGIKTVLERKLNFTTLGSNAISINVRSDVAGSVHLRLERNSGGITPVEVSGSYINPGSWQKITFDLRNYLQNDVFDLVAILPDFGQLRAGTWYIDNVMLDNYVIPPFSGTNIVDFDNVIRTFEGWSGIGLQVAQNPNKTGINTSNYALRTITSADPYEGVKTVLESNIDFSHKNSLSIMVLSDSIGIVHLKLQKAGNDSIGATEASCQYTTPGVWQKLSFDLTSAPGNQYDLIALRPDYGGTNAGITWYLDQFTLDSIQITQFGGDTLANFDGVKRIFQSWDGASVSVVNNPKKLGINTSNKVLKEVSSAAQYEGIKDLRERKLDFSYKNAISVQVLSDSLGITLLKLSGPGANDIISKYQYTTPGNWQKLTFDLTGTQTNAYNLIAVFPYYGNTSGNVAWYVDNFTLDSVRINPWPSDTIANFDEAKRLFEGWDNIQFSTIANPYKNGINTSNTVMKIVTSMAQYEGIQTSLERNLDFTKSRSNQFTVKVYSTVTGPVHLKLYKLGADTIYVVKIANYTTPNQWQLLTYDLSGVASNLYNVVAIYPDLGGTTAGVTWLFDDFVIQHPLDLNPYSNWDGVTKTFTAIGNATFTAPFANPSQSGINTSANVMKINTTTQTNEGVQSNLGQYIDFTTSSVIQLKVYSTSTGRIDITLAGIGVSTKSKSVLYNTASIWQLLSFDFGASIQAGVYNTLSILPDSGQARTGTWYIDDLTGPKLITTPVVLSKTYADWETISPTLETWQSLSTSVVANPLIAGIDQSAHALQTTTNGASTYEGFAINSTKVFNFANGRSFALNVKSNVSGQIMLKLESSYTDPIYIQLPYTVLGSWQQLVYTFDSNAESKYNKISIFPDIGGTGTAQWYFDNIQGPTTLDKVIIFTSSITENRENGKKITANLIGDVFAASLNKTYWVATGLPSGVSIGAVTRVDNTHATITLNGNSTGNLGYDINVTITVNKNQFVSNSQSQANSFKIIAKGGFTQTRTKKVFAHYLPWYNTFPEIPGVAPARDKWCYGSDCADNLSHIIYSNKPIIGEYSQFDNDVLEYHFLTMYAAGIDGLIIDLNQDMVKEKMITMNCLNELKMMNEKYPNFNLKFIIAYDQKNTGADIYADFKYIRDSLTNNPKFSSFRFNDDKTGYPVIMTWADFNKPDFSKFIDSVYNKQVVYIKRDASNYNLCDATFEWVNYLDYNNSPLGNNYYWGNNYLDDQEKNAANQNRAYPVSQRNYLMMGGVWPGFDDHNVPSDWNNGSPRWINRTVIAGETMALTFDKQTGYNARRDSGVLGPVLVEMPWIQLITWNDWPEGTSIEPATSNTYGFTAIKTTQKKIAQFKNSGTPDTSAVRIPYAIYQARKNGNTGYALCMLDQLLSGNRSYNSVTSICSSGYTKFIPVPYRSKETTNYSGAACVKMVLDFEGTNSTMQSTIQTYAVAHNYTSNIGQSFIDPYGIYMSLNNFEVVSPYNYAQLTKTTQSAAFNDMCYWMSYNIPNVDPSKMNMPVVVPTGGNFNNWVVVNGFRSSGDPHAGSYTVYGFYVKDPNVNGIGQNIYIQATSFGNNYFRPIISSDIWNGKYVSVDEPPVNKVTITIQTPMASKFKPTNNSLRFLATEEGLKKLNLIPNDANVITAMNSAKRGRVYFVNLPGTVNDYYIVTYEKNGGCILAAIIDANDGALKEVSYAEEADYNYYKYLQESWLKSAASAEKIINSFYPSIASSLDVDEISTLESTSGFDFEITPNPAGDMAKIIVYGNEGTISIIVYNISGELVKNDYITSIDESENYQLNLHGLDNGVYAIRVISGSETKTKMLIIRK